MVPDEQRVINLYRYREIALAANERYLKALSVVENPAPAYRQVEKITEPVVKAGRSYAGFNPASGPDVKLFGAVLDGDHLVRGFRNADIREALYETTADPAERRRQSAAVGRLLKRLHVRGLIRKVPRSRRWHVSPSGHRVLQGVMQLYHRGIPKSNLIFLLILRLLRRVCSRISGQRRAGLGFVSQNGSNNVVSRSSTHLS